MQQLWATKFARTHFWGDLNRILEAQLFMQAQSDVTAWLGGEWNGLSFFIYQSILYSVGILEKGSKALLC